MKKYLKFGIIILFLLFSLPDFTKAEIPQDKKNYLLGKFNPLQRKDFVAIPLKYTMHQNKIYLQKETYKAFLKMRTMAKKEGISLKIASATRNFIYQKDLWNKKWTGKTLVDTKNLKQTIPDELARFKKILEYSAVPGTSRHHWGTDIDINNAVPEYFDSEKGKKEYNWLIKNAPTFGFCQTYNEREKRVNGYNEEKWHWSYLPIAKELTQDYKNNITKNDINNFNGDQYIEKIDLINDYVLNINPECL